MCRLGIGEGGMWVAPGLWAGTRLGAHVRWALGGKGQDEEVMPGQASAPGDTCGWWWCAGRGAEPRPWQLPASPFAPGQQPPDVTWLPGRGTSTLVPPS